MLLRQTSVQGIIQQDCKKHAQEPRIFTPGLVLLCCAVCMHSWGSRGNSSTAALFAKKRHDSVFLPPDLRMTLHEHQVLILLSLPHDAWQLQHCKHEPWLQNVTTTESREGAASRAKC
mmetsp:Transcript_36640/g.72479  ORF Transcript_36640/g.72479 Transcript_36640/m.72479 type:complete len:118 (+) Transcript_36640:129-482(+)